MRTDYGQVEVVLGDTAYMLVPTLAALQKIDRQYGSLREAAGRVAVLDLDAVCHVIAAGAGLGQKQAQALPQQVFDAGIAPVAAPVTEYLTLLLNPSGREPSETDEAAAAGKA